MYDLICSNIGTPSSPLFIICNFSYANSFDFIASFSSIEHSGLGRYGDPSDPIGDLREMQKFHCLLKRGSVVFVGFPVGQDEIVFNLHRIYGAVRLALMFAGT